MCRCCLACLLLTCCVSAAATCFWPLVRWRPTPLLSCALCALLQTTSKCSLPPSLTHPPPTPSGNRLVYPSSAFSPSALWRHALWQDLPIRPFRGPSPHLVGPMWPFQTTRRGACLWPVSPLNTPCVPCLSSGPHACLDGNRRRSVLAGNKFGRAYKWGGESRFEILWCCSMLPAAPVAARLPWTPNSQIAEMHNIQKVKYMTAAGGQNEFSIKTQICCSRTGPQQHPRRVRGGT